MLLIIDDRVMLLSPLEVPCSVMEVARVPHTHGEHRHAHTGCAGVSDQS